MEFGLADNKVMGGYGSGRYKVLTDYQREVRMKRAGKKWRLADRDRYNAYMREYRKKNYEKTLKLDRESKQRKRLRMIEDAFERVMDRKDGFACDLTKKEKEKAYQRDYYHRTKVLKPRERLTEEERKSRRKESVKKYCQKWWIKNKAKCIEERKPYQKEWRAKNAEKIRAYQRDWYHRNKTKALSALQTELLHTLV